MHHFLAFIYGFSTAQFHASIRETRADPVAGFRGARLARPSPHTDTAVVVSPSPLPLSDTLDRKARVRGASFALHRVSIVGSLPARHTVE